MKEVFKKSSKMVFETMKIRARRTNLFLLPNSLKMHATRVVVVVVIIIVYYH